jgi:hypothetical protein
MRDEGRGSSKTSLKYVYQKSPRRELFPKNRPKFRCQFFLDFFLFCRVFGCFSANSDVSSKPLDTKKMHKNRVRRKKITKKLTKNPKPIFLDFFCHVFGRFSVRGVKKKTFQKNLYRKNKSDPGPFWASDLPTCPRGTPKNNLGGPLDLDKRYIPGPQPPVSAVSFCFCDLQIRGCLRFWAA